MRPEANPNIEILEAAVGRLGQLVNDVVFLGGCTTGLLLTDPAAPPIRVTKDVDIMVEVISLAAYHGFTQMLKNKGFSEDTSPNAPICRWKHEEVILDVMPTDPQILGFGNRWFARAFKAAQSVELPSGRRISLLPTPYFLATKLEAFDNRGGGDYLMSRDMEDIVTVLDGRPEVIEEVRNAEEDLRKQLQKRVSQLFDEPSFRYALPGLLPPDAASQARISIIEERIEAILSD